MAWDETEWIARTVVRYIYELIHSEIIIAFSTPIVCL